MTDLPTPFAPDDPPVSDAVLRALTTQPDSTVRLLRVLRVPVTDADSLLRLMNTVCRESVEVFPGVLWMSVTAQFDDQPFTAAQTDAPALALDERQYADQDGPCLRAMRTGVSVAMTLQQVRDRWPELAGSAGRIGVASFFAVPLHAHTNAVGALNIYSSRPAADRPDADLLQLMTDYLGRALTDYQDSRPAADGEAALRESLARAALIEQAVGVMMAITGADADEARAALHDLARSSGHSVEDEAAEVVAGRMP